MSKITAALKKAEEERANKFNRLVDSKGDHFFTVRKIKEGKMKNSWLIWVFIIGVILTIFFAFNYQGNKNAVPLAKIFPDEETMPVDVEYEFVDAVVEQPKEEVVPTPKQVDMEKTIEKSVKKEEPVSKKEVNKRPIEVKKPEKIPFTIQVCSVKNKKRAEGELDKLLKDNYQAQIVSKDLGSKGVWYRIYVGNFATKSEAEKFLVEFKKKYKDSFVISPTF